MVGKSAVALSAFRLVGELFVSYNDIRTDLVEIGKQLVDKVAANMGNDGRLNFNAKRVKPAKNGKLGEFTSYNVPVGMLSVIASSDVYSMENGSILSRSEELEITYLAEMELAEMPKNTSRLIELLVAKELTFTFPAYRDHQGMFDIMISNEYNRLMASDGLILLGGGIDG